MQWCVCVCVCVCAHACAGVGVYVRKGAACVCHCIVPLFSRCVRVCAHGARVQACAACACMRACVYVCIHQCFSFCSQPQVGPFYVLE